MLRGPGQLSRDSDSVRGGRSGGRIPVGARFYTPILTDPGAHPVSYKVSTRFYPGVTRLGHGADHPLSSSAEVKEIVELYLKRGLF